MSKFGIGAYARLVANYECGESGASRFAVWHRSGEFVALYSPEGTQLAIASVPRTWDPDHREEMAMGIMRAWGACAVNAFSEGSYPRRAQQMIDGLGREVRPGDKVTLVQDGKVSMFAGFRFNEPGIAMFTDLDTGQCMPTIPQIWGCRTVDID